MKIYYGVTRLEQVFQLIEDVVEKLKGSNENTEATKQLLIGTISQETKLGTYRDPSPYKHGAGLCQIDPGIPFEDIQDRGTKYIRLVKDKFGIDMLSASHRELELSPLLSVVMARVKYKLVPKSIPISFDGQWEYYKRYYNSYAGKATKEEYKKNYEWGIKLYNNWLETKEV